MQFNTYNGQGAGLFSAVEISASFSLGEKRRPALLMSDSFWVPYAGVCCAEFCSHDGAGVTLRRRPERDQWGKASSRQGQPQILSCVPTWDSCEAIEINLNRTSLCNNKHTSQDTLTLRACKIFANRGRPFPCSVVAEGGELQITPSVNVFPLSPFTEATRTSEIAIRNGLMLLFALMLSYYVGEPDCSVCTASISVSFFFPMRQRRLSQ